MVDSIDTGQRLIAYDGGLKKHQTVEFAAAQKVRLKLEALNEALNEARELRLDVTISQKSKHMPVTSEITQRL